MSTKDIYEDHEPAPHLGLGSSERLGLLVNSAMLAEECLRLAEWALIGPVQRAALESFAERLLAADRARIKRDVAGLHMAQSANNQNYPSAWHDGIDAALEAIGGA